MTEGQGASIAHTRTKRKIQQGLIHCNHLEPACQLNWLSKIGNNFLLVTILFSLAVKSSRIIIYWINVENYYIFQESSYHDNKYKFVQIFFIQTHLPNINIKKGKKSLKHFCYYKNLSKKFWWITILKFMKSLYRDTSYGSVRLVLVLVRRN